MDHVEFDFFEDFTAPLIEFLEKCRFDLNSARDVKNRIIFPQRLFHIPESFKKQNKRDQKPEKSFQRSKTQTQPVSVSIDLWK